MRDSLDTFEAMLDGRDHLMGDFSAADVCTWPFLRFAATPQEEDDPYLFHEILIDNLPLTDRHPRLRGWIHRVAERPLAPAVS